MPVTLGYVQIGLPCCQLVAITNGREVRRIGVHAVAKAHAGIDPPGAKSTKERPSKLRRQQRLKNEALMKKLCVVTLIP
jgi:hypothetical protein